MKKIMKVILTFMFIFGMILPNFSTVKAENIQVQTESISLVKLKDIFKHWAEDIIKKAVEKGFIQGYPDGTFRPNNNVTRAEFAQFLARAFDGDERKQHSFVDIPHNFWATDAINEGLALGFIHPNDYPNQKFEPNKIMTRAEWKEKYLLG